MPRRSNSIKMDPRLRDLFSQELKLGMRSKPRIVKYVKRIL